MIFVFHYASHTFHFYFSSSNISNMVSELVWSNELLEGLKSMKFQNKVDGQVTPTKKKKKRCKMIVHNKRIEILHQKEIKET